LAAGQENKKMRKPLIFLILILFIIANVVGACTSTPETVSTKTVNNLPASTTTPTEPSPTIQETKEPTATPTPTTAPAQAKFLIKNMDITPLEVMAGETVTVTAVVENTGGSEGTYNAVLSLDGVTADTQNVSITPGNSETVTFSFTKSNPGTYAISIGELSANLIVNQKLMAKEIELKYDNDKVRGNVGTQLPYLSGYITDFTPPGTPFTIKKIKIYGMFNTRLNDKDLADKTFDLEIADENLKILNSATYMNGTFPDTPAWVEFEVPDIEVDGLFCVYIYNPDSGIRIGADDSIINEHSNTTIQTEEGAITILVQWPYTPWEWIGDKKLVNWMIRVDGIYMAPAE
jgi:flagellar basal body-associated protein FliL